MIQSAIETIMVLLGIILLGYWAATRPWFSNGIDIFSKYLTCLALPFNVYRSVVIYFVDTDNVFTLVMMALSVAAIHVLCLFIGYGVSLVTRTARSRQAVLIGAVSFPNVIFLGFPVVEGVFGAQALSFGIIYYFISQLMFWTVGTFLLFRFGDNSAAEGGFFNWKNLKKIFSPSLIALALGIVTVAFSVPLPGVLMEIITKMAQTTTGISMIFIGAVIRNAVKNHVKISLDLVYTLLTKLILTPLGVFLFLNLLPFDPLAKSVFFVLSIMPMSVNFSVLAHEYKCDYEFGAVVASMMNIIGMASIPLFILCIEKLGLFL